MHTKILFLKSLGCDLILADPATFLCTRFIYNLEFKRNYFALFKNIQLLL